MNSINMVGKTVTLTILRIGSVGAYVGTAEEDRLHGGILLPKKYLTGKEVPGDTVSVFIYRDSEDRLIATTEEPFIKAETFSYLTVKSQTSIGAFLDWGLAKDLLVPFKEQEEKLRAGQKTLAYAYPDKSGRMAATTKIYRKLSAPDKGEFAPENPFIGVVYRITEEYGVFVAVYPAGTSPERDKSLSKLYFGLIPPSEVWKTYTLGEIVRGRVLRVRDDGKMDLSVRKKERLQVTEDCEKVLEVIREYKGVLPFSDNADPEWVRTHLCMSKNAFKKALSRLYKERKIEIHTNEVVLLEK